MHVVGTAGHVDHGKSALVQALTGVDPDRLEEEKRRGMTIDLGFAWMSLPSGEEIGIIDVPGHERFIRNMLAGAGGISVCLFVVAANEGWRRQSTEHLAILDVLDIQHGVIAVTKTDLATPEQMDRTIREIRERTAGTSLRALPVIPCSAVTRAGLDRLTTALAQALDDAPAPLDRGRPRLWIDRSFTIAGSGTVVTGTTVGGAFAQGAEVEIAPQRAGGRIRSIQTHRKTVAEAAPGTRTAINIVGIAHDAARRGNAVVRPAAWRSTRLADVEIRIVADEAAPAEMTEKGSYLAYVGTAESPATIRFLGTHKLSKGERAAAQLQLRDELPLERGDRFVIRDAGRVLTLAGGIVVDPVAPRAGRHDDARRALIHKLARATSGEALVLLVTHYGELDRTEALFRSNATSDDTATAVVLGSKLLSPARFASLQAKALHEVESHHQTSPLERGMPRERLRHALGLTSHGFDELVALTSEIEAEEGIVRSSSHAVTLTGDESRSRDELLATLVEAGFSPPLVKDMGVDVKLIRALADRGEIVKVDNFYLTRENADEARRRVADRIRVDGPLTVAQIRDLLGTTRKYAVPLCEWLDATGTTIRKGDVRILGPHA